MLFQFLTRRTPFEKFLITNGVTKSWLSENTGLDVSQICEVCEEKRLPNDEGVVVKIIMALRRKGFEVSITDFWTD